MQSGEYTPSRTTLLLCLVPIAVVAAGIAVLGVDIPYVDQLRFVSLLQRSRDGVLTAADLFAQNNENRPFFPRLIWLGLAALTRYDVRAELWANLAVAIATFTFLAVHAVRVWRRAGVTPPALLLPLMSFMVFNWGQWEAWLNGFQAVFFLGSAGAVIGFILLADETTPARFALATTIGILATFSTPNAVLYWPIGLGLIMLSGPWARRVSRAAIWLFAGALCFGVYMTGWGGPPGFGLHVLSREFLARAYWVTNFLGAPMMTVPGAAFPLGVLSLALWATAIWSITRTDDWKRYLAFLAIGLFVVGSGLLVSLVRLSLGTLQAVASGYLTVSAWYWAALLALSPLLRFPRLARMALYSLTLVCLLWLTIWGLALGNEYHRRLQRAYDAAVSGEAMSDEVLQNIARPDQYDMARGALRYLEHERLSAYADGKP